MCGASSLVNLESAFGNGPFSLQAEYFRASWIRWGAVEVGARYSHLDLDDGRVRGGIMDIGTVRVNWYSSPYVKTGFNYGVAGVGRHDPDGRVFIFQGRFELDF